jgi:hypothetical protein
MEPQKLLDVNLFLHRQSRDPPESGPPWSSIGTWVPLLSVMSYATRAGGDKPRHYDKNPHDVVLLWRLQSPANFKARYFSGRNDVW